MSNKHEGFNEIKSILEKGSHTLKNPNFEDKLMSRISTEESYRVRVNILIKKAVICFILGILLIAVLLTWLLLSGDTYHLLSIISLFVLGVIGLLMIDNFAKLLRNYDLKRISKRATFEKQTPF